jgi:hypothetical protein
MFGRLPNNRTLAHGKIIMIKVPEGKTKVKVRVTAGAYGIKFGYIDNYSTHHGGYSYAMVVDVESGRIRPIEPASLVVINDFPEG